MKKLIAFLSLSILVLISTTVVAQDANTENSTESIKVYYFHTDYRCATCKAVEEEAYNAIEENYPDQLKNEEIEFFVLNIEEDEGEKIAEELKVNSQSLIITKGDKKEDITTFAFLNARSNPEKLHEKIKEVIDSI